MVPGLDVAQINSSTWAVSSRGFNSGFADKLLVLIDGRSVYNPDFSFVSWDMQNVLLEDVERIEVIRGPGETLWGFNSVNGVINIITKSAKDSQGAYVMAGGGTQDRNREAVRYGGKIGDDFFYRVYGLQFDEGPGYNPAGGDADAWRQGKCGFRTDYQPDHGKTNVVTVQGDHFQGVTGTNNFILWDMAIPASQSGENVLSRWRHVFDEDNDLQLQTYYDRYSNDILAPNYADETVKTFERRTSIPISRRRAAKGHVRRRLSQRGEFCPRHRRIRVNRTDPQPDEQLQQPVHSGRDCRRR